MEAASTDTKQKEDFRPWSVVEKPSFSKYNVKMLSKSGAPISSFSMYTDLKGIEEEVENKN